MSVRGYIDLSIDWDRSFVPAKKSTNIALNTCRVPKYTNFENLVLDFSNYKQINGIHLQSAKST